MALAKFVSNLASSVKMLHTVTTSGLIKRVPNESLELACKKRQLVFRCAGIQNAKNLSLQKTNLSRLPSFTARNVTGFGTWWLSEQSLFTL